APVGGVVASGNATISASGLVTTVNQSTDRAVIDWSSFNLAQNETARFVVPSDSGATLNRISGGVSTISGSVESNGTVYFANPNGLVFDATSRVSANGFVATTGTISNFDFMSRGEFSNLGSGWVTLNGAVSAPAITALAGSVTVGGNLAAGSGKILLSSSNLTTIGQGATISADAGANETGGNIKIWSDSHTDFLGTITALGGSNSGDGGFVEVSGKRTLNFSGTVSTLAAHGKTGTLLLDPSDITISTGTDSSTNTGGTITSNNAASIVNTTTLKTALASNNIIIDANAGTGTGSGLITVANDILAATAGSNSLTLTGSQIIINANITMRSGGNLTLNATKASVWQNPSTLITATTLSGSSVDGFALGGANLITNLGTITNSGSAGVMVKNAQALTITASKIDGGSGGVMIVAPNKEVTISGA
ncbi:MAG: filamentous hemagglutinin N-terminal domain-containing protein, partial [Alphaproteobacteria bacterium]|nr:filamentous hemagglutinin N-terminal domain-containing protein [Alphaproteobacteria bacterium]